MDFAVVMSTCLVLTYFLIKPEVSNPDFVRNI